MVRKVQSFCSELKLRIPGSSNLAYSNARGRLPTDDVDLVGDTARDRVLSGVREDQRWPGRQVKVVPYVSIFLPALFNQRHKGNPRGSINRK